ncbi:MAG: tripartite tricarboxylate transporter permease, partial [Alphaproteobacteria bacterium]
MTRKEPAASLTQALGAFAVALEPGAIPAEVRARARLCLLDFAGVTLAGAREPAMHPLAGLVGAVVLAHGSVAKAVGMILLGLLLGLVGTDLNTGRQRYTFGIPELSDGIGFVTLAMGLFGVAQVLVNLEQHAMPRATAIVGSLWPSREELRRSVPATLRGTAIGSLLGVLPGGGAILASFAAYALEKKVSREPGRFG